MGAYMLARVCSFLLPCDPAGSFTDESEQPDTGAPCLSDGLGMRGSWAIALFPGIPSPPAGLALWETRRPAISAQDSAVTVGTFWHPHSLLSGQGWG